MYPPYVVHSLLEEQCVYVIKFVQECTTLCSTRSTGHTMCTVYNLFKNVPPYVVHDPLGVLCVRYITCLGMSRLMLYMIYWAYYVFLYNLFRNVPPYDVLHDPLGVLCVCYITCFGMYLLMFYKIYWAYYVCVISLVYRAGEPEPLVFGSLEPEP